MIFPKDNNSPPLLNLSEFSLQNILGEDFEKNQDLLLYDTLPAFPVAIASESHYELSIEQTSTTDASDKSSVTIEINTQESLAAESVIVFCIFYNIFKGL
jgi:hypothetical protein